MSISTESFSSILRQAKRGQLQLPEFQRDYSWRRQQVVELFDSLRQRYPIGSFLFMERNTEIELDPRPFAGTEDIIEMQQPEAYVLDGQQRITSGLALYYGVGSSQYYIDLDKLWTLGKQQVDLDDEASVRSFLIAIDTDDGYCVGRQRRADPLRLLDAHLLYTSVLSSGPAMSAALKRYIEAFPAREKFVETVIRDNFRLGEDALIPVMRVERDRPVEAISRIFATLNSTGKPLTPFELVVALLYPAGIRLRSDIDENRELAPHYANMDATGEVFLQTIAMLAGESPKKSQLPKTIRPDRYKKYKNEAVDILERLGEFLTQRLGVGLDKTSSLVPYDSIFAPMAIALRHLSAEQLPPVPHRHAERKLEKWFVAAALSNRYQEGVHNKQTSDLSDAIRWLQTPGDENEPAWVTERPVPRLTSATPEGAIGRMLRCLINRRKPADPISDNPVGFQQGAVVTDKHHIWPTRFCNKFVQGWTSDNSSDLALNVTMTSQETNNKWLNSNPADQYSQIIEAHNGNAQSVAKMLEAHFIDQTCIDIMRRPEKTKDDFEAFLSARERLFLKELEAWGLTHQDPNQEPIED